MKLRIYQSAQGDCLLLEANTGELVLCDGGMTSSMSRYVRSDLTKLRTQGKELALVYISHIDRDHISGVLQLLEDEVEWRVYDHHRASGTPVKKPTVPRPPVIRGILHNAFRDQIAANQGSIESLLAARAIENVLGAMAPSLYATAVPELAKAAGEMQAIATGVSDAIKVGKLIAPDALDIPINKPPGTAGPAKLLYAGRPGERFALGSMDFTLIGPTEKELKNLRDGWDNWLKRSPDAVKKIRAQVKKRVDAFSNGELDGSPFDLHEWEGIPSYEGVTVPNIASLMFVVEENGKRLLLTGDGQQDFILAGLKRTGFLANGYVHLDVLKVQHHGSENNIDVDFARKVSADHYVFCGNGESANPDLGVINIIYNSRLGKQSVRALAPESQNRAFHFWFSTTAAEQIDHPEAQEHFVKLEAKVAKLEAKADGKLTTHYNKATAVDLTI